MATVNTGITVDGNILAALDQWATDEFRSRNNLIQMILTQAVQRKQAAQQIKATLKRDALPGEAFPNADADKDAGK